MRHKIICALDTGDLGEALATVKRLKPFCGAFKINYGLTLPYGLDVIDRFHDAGAERLFLDLKFHDIPNSVAIGVREAAKRGVWMLTLHLSGGPAMVTAAVEEARTHSIGAAPLLVGVSVLTSLNEHDLKTYLGTDRSVIEHMTKLSLMGMECGLDGVVCSVHEARQIRESIHKGIIVTPGIRPAHGDLNDQRRVGDGKAALEAGADYMVIGRALTSHPDPARALADLGLDVAQV